jgi:hypothetical protein
VKDVVRGMKVEAMIMTAIGTVRTWLREQDKAWHEHVEVDGDFVGKDCMDSVSHSS